MNLNLGLGSRFKVHKPWRRFKKSEYISEVNFYKMPKRKSTMSQHYNYMARLKRRRVRSASRKMTTSKVKKIAQKVINKQTEFKRRLDYITNQTITSISTGHLLFDGPQIVSGDGLEQRDGAQVNLKSLKFKLLFKYESVPVQVRLILVRYPQGSESPSLADLLTHPTNSQVMISPWLKNGPVKYSVLQNKIIKLGGEATMSSTYKEKIVEFAVKLPSSGQKITYESGTTQTPDKNRYSLFVVQNILPALNADRVQVNGFVSTGFTDS